MIPVGAKWKLFVPADLGYGDNIGAANIPPGATLIFELELLSIEPKPKAAEAPSPGNNEKQERPRPGRRAGVETVARAISPPASPAGHTDRTARRTPARARATDPGAA